LFYFVIEISEKILVGHFSNFFMFEIKHLLNNIDARNLEVELAAVDPASSRDAHRTNRGVLPADVSGLVRVDLAEAEFRKVLATSPNSSSALNYLGYMLADRNVRPTTA
jgi:hypothetical protein